MRSGRGRLSLVLFLLGLCACALANSGCDVFVNIAHRAVIDPLQYHEPTDELLSCARMRIQANSAWHDFERESCDVAYSRHYARGFKTGFVEQLETGLVEPPVLPPREYWKVCYETPEGHRDINDWFDGYRAGAIAAEASGHRQYIVIPVALPRSRESSDGSDCTNDTASNNEPPTTVLVLASDTDMLLLSERERAAESCEDNEVEIIQTDATDDGEDSCAACETCGARRSSDLQHADLDTGCKLLLRATVSGRGECGSK